MIAVLLQADQIVCLIIYNIDLIFGVRSAAEVIYLSSHKSLGLKHT